MLTIVPTPLGNRGDITLRALEALREAELIACEDTRRTWPLLEAYGITGKKLVACHEHNEDAATGRLLAELRNDKRVAVVSDGGTPVLSDPGFRLARAAREAGLPVTVLPGPAACITALIASGLPVASFTFHGFPPRKPGRLAKLLLAESESGHTQIFYESPQRVGRLLAAAAESFGPDRRGAICRELTKLHEEIRTGTLAELAAGLAAGPGLNGEGTVVIAGRSGRRTGADESAPREGDTE